jgi:hypothetical protein
VSHDGGAAVVAGSTYHVFWVGDGGHLVQTWWAGSRWHKQNLGGKLAGAVAATYRAGRYDVFGVSPGGRLYQRTYHGGSWGRWHAVASGFRGGVSAVRTGSTYHVFGHNPAGRLRHAYWAGHRWHVHNLGGVTSGTPAVTLHHGRYDVFAVSASRRVYERTYYPHASWGRWHAVASGFAPGVSAVWAGGRDHVFGESSAGHGLQAYPSRAGWHVQHLDGTFDSPLAASYRAGRYDVYGEAGGRLYHKFYRSSTGWHGWHKVTVTKAPKRPRATAALQLVGPGSAGSYSLARNTDHSLVRWNPCRTIGYKVNTREASRGALADVKGAIWRLEQATGLKFRYDGSTSEIPDVDGKPSSDDVVIAWARPSQTDALYGSAVGTGGWFETGRYGAGGKITWQITGGYVALDSTQNATFRAGFGHGVRRGTLLMHELGHVVGLQHAHSSSQVMYPTITPSASGIWGAGDLTGLRKEGRASGCIS